MALIVEIADAVVDELNAGSFEADFTAARDYRPRFTPADLKELRVTVVPRALSVEAESRARQCVDATIDIAIQRRLDSETTEEIDPLMELVDQIVAFWKLRRPSSLSQALCVEVANEPIYAVEHLDQLRVFTSVVSLTFRLVVE